MTLPRPLFFLVRAVFGIFMLLTASYCLLAYLPFTYHQIVVEAPLPWLSLFVRLHPYLYWLVSGLQVLTMIPDLRRESAATRPSLSGIRILAAGYLVFAVGLGVFLLVHPLLAGIRNEIGSLYWGLVFFLPLLWVAALDWLGQRGRLQWGESGGEEDRRIFRAAWEPAVFLALLYYAIFFLRWGRLLTTEFGSREGILCLSWMVIYHLVVFMGVFVTLSVVHVAGR